MSSEHELLQRALDALLEVHDVLRLNGRSKVVDDIRKELQKPIPIPCGSFVYGKGMISMGFYTVDNINNPVRIPDGTYNLFAILDQ